MIKQFLMVRDLDQVIQGTMLQDDPDAGPLQRPASPVPDGIHLVEWAGEFNRAAHPEAAVATCIDGVPVWSDPTTLEELRTAKVGEMSEFCADAILAGFVSSALGMAYTYPAKPNDQLNLLGSVAASFYPNVGADWLTPFWCADAAGVWAFRAHTAAQIQQVGVDGKNAILNCMKINERLAAQIMTAAADQLAAIAWPA